MNTADYLLDNGFDDDIAFVTHCDYHTYHDLRAAAARLVGELISVGVTQGDRVGILGENSLFWAAAYLAIMKLSAIAVPFPTVSTKEELNRKIEFVDCKVIFADRRSIRRFANSIHPEVYIISEDIL